MKKYFILILILAAAANFAADKSFKITIKNSLNSARVDAVIKIPIEKLTAKALGLLFNSFSVLDGKKEIPYQLEMKGNKVDAVYLLMDFKPKEIKKLKFVYGETYTKNNFKSRTYAELAVLKSSRFDGKRLHGTKFENVTGTKVPSNHIDHDGLFKYEGPGWESDKIGYRMYLDWRNATDIFGKKVDRIVLDKVGVTDTIADNNESFHTMQEWGMDIFKVGSSLGVGSFGMWADGKVNMVSKTDSTTCKISMNGPLRSEIITNYSGWAVNNNKYNLESSLSINAGSRLTKSMLKVSGNAANLVTGLAKYAGTNFIKGNSKKGWNYIALYGHQSLAGDNLGIVIFYRNKDLIELTEDALSYIVKLKPVSGAVEYYFGAAWENELNGIKNEKEFIKYLNAVVLDLNNPLIVE